MTTATKRAPTEAEIDKLSDEMYDEYVSEFLKLRRPDPEVIGAWIRCIYKTLELPLQPIEILPNRVVACRLASDRTGEKVTSLDRWGSGDAGWIARRDAGIRLGLLGDPDLADDVKGLLAFRNFTRCAWDTIVLDDLAIVVALPNVYHYDDAENLHCANGPAIAWEDHIAPDGAVTTDREYFWHGQSVPERVILAPRSYTKDEYLAISNTEERRAIGENGGWSWLVDELLGCSSLDKWTDPNTGLAYELLGSGARRFLRKESPALKAGAKPSYVEPVHQRLRTAAGARKWQAVRNASPEECDAVPELTYKFEL